jgi:SAM-dependent methyltransferase
MNRSPAPIIFAPARRLAASARAAVLQARPGAARYLVEDVAEDVAERLAFLRHAPGRTLVLGDASGVLERALRAVGAEAVTAEFSLEDPWPDGGFKTIVSAFAHDTANDLPGALIHARRALAPGGLALITMLGAGSLPALRAIMVAADGERASPRLHPQVDVRAGAQLLQRAGFADPVADSRSLAVRFGTLARLVGDLREQGLSGVLAQGGPPLGKEALARARAAFTAEADEDGRVTERFELMTLSGWAART